MTTTNPYDALKNADLFFWLMGRPVLGKIIYVRLLTQTITLNWINETKNWTKLVGNSLN